MSDQDSSGEIKAQNHAGSPTQAPTNQPDATGAGALTPEDVSAQVPQPAADSQQAAPEGHSYPPPDPYAVTPVGTQGQYTPPQYTEPIPQAGANTGAGGQDWWSAGATGPGTTAVLAPNQSGGGSGGGAKKAIAAGVIAGILAGGIAGLGAYVLADRLGISSTASGTQINPSDASALSPRANNSIAAIAKNMVPTVASIKVTAGSGGDTGSGFVIRPDGYILTNNHVVSAAADGNGSVTVQLQDGDPLDAKIVGRSVAYDLAVLKIARTGLRAVTLGNSSSVVVGDAAIAIGSPLGLRGTVTSGIISAVRRPVTAGGQGQEASFISALQTDAAINPGNSGGPLVNSEGQVIGVNSAIATLGSSNTGQTGSIGLGFAIPVNNAKRISDEIISGGKSTIPVIGITVVTDKPGPGAEVRSVVADGPAAKAGLVAGDTITEIDGERVDGPTEMLSQIRAFGPGQQVTLKVKSKNGDTKDVTLTLGSKVG